MDTLQIKVSDRETPMTKRGILSYSSSIFDPFGILSPVTLESKLIIQSLLKEKVDWDDEIPYNLKNRFEKWKENLKNWNAVEILRWYYLDKNNDTELHIFTHASASAYGAVAYFRCKYQGKFKCSSIMSKARLTPIIEKQLTILRLELQAAVLGCRMRSVIIEETKCEFKAVHLWTDSKIVINYIKNETKNFGVIIAHRINEIRNNSTVNEWHYVSTKDNIADDLTRYKGFDSLQKTSRSCNGPDFLYNSLEDHEIISVNTMSTKDKDKTFRRTSNKGQSTVLLTAELNREIPSQNVFINWLRCSSLTKLVRHLA